MAPAIARRYLFSLGYELFSGCRFTVKTDSLFYALFQSNPAILFELIGRPVDEAQGYRFASEEVKQTALRLDGVFLPPSDRLHAPVYFLEVQMQRDPLLYRRLFAEVFLYLKQYPQVRQWCAVVIYPNAAAEFAEPETFGNLLTLPEVTVVYLDALRAMSELSPGLGVLRLMTAPVATVPAAARGLIEQVQRASMTATERTQLLELIKTIVVYTFPRLTREEIATMLELTDMKETRVYQEGREAGREEGLEREKALILRLLHRKLGELPRDLQERVSQLPLAMLEALGEALFDFEEIADLQAWLAQLATTEE